MDKSYTDFVERMGSFEDVLDISGENLKHSDLTHFGIMGMKWGHRNDNTIRNVKWASSDGKHNTPFKMNANVAGKAAKTGQDITSLGQTINKGGFNKKAVKEAKGLSDEDLKRLTTRLNLENNYINAQQQQSGRSKVESILSTTGSALAVASSAAILYETIKKLQG